MPINMDCPPNPQPQLSTEELFLIIQRDKERRSSSQPQWYHLTRAAMPVFACQAQDRYAEERRAQAESEDKDKMTPQQCWSQVEVALQEKLPDLFTVLGRLQEHVDFWTLCDDDKIAELFRDLHTEQERLSAVVGSDIVLPEEPIALNDESLDSQVSGEALRSGHIESDSDESFVFELERPPKKKNKKKKKAKSKQAGSETEQTVAISIDSQTMIDADSATKEPSSLQSTMHSEELNKSKTGENPRKRKREKREKVLEQTGQETKSEANTADGADS